MTDLPLLPRGTVVFADLPARAIMLEPLAPSIGNGLLRIRSRYGHGFVLVRDGAVFESFAFPASGPLTGATALAEFRQWPDAELSADRLDLALVDLSAALVRAESLYEDLRLEWTGWTSLLADLSRRVESAYIVELTTPAGRGVTCVAAGRQMASYTDVHPDLGDPALLEAMAASGEGTIRVRRIPAAMFASLGQVAAAVPADQPAAKRDEPASNGAEPAAMSWTDPLEPLNVPPAHLRAEEPSTAPAAASHAADPENRDASDLGWVAPWNVAWGDVVAEDAPPAESSPLQRLTVTDVHAELTEIARRRLRMSAQRVEVALESAAAQDLPLDRVLEDLRSMTIRGVMQPTIDAMIDEMMEAAGRRVA